MAGYILIAVSHIISTVIIWTGAFFIGYFILVNTLLMMFLFVSFFAVWQYRRAVRKAGNITNFPPVTIIIPTFNEVLVIEKTLRALLCQDYPQLEIIIVDDGSTDRTLEVLKDKFALERTHVHVEAHIPTQSIKEFYRSRTYPNVLVVEKANGGKYDALNCGINLTRSRIFANMDADTILDGQAVRRMASAFVRDARVVAAGSHILVGNGCRLEGCIYRPELPKSFILMVQVVEYMWAFVAERVGWAAFNGLVIISGAFAMFRKDRVLEVGGYQGRTLSEDMDLVVTLHEYHLRKRLPYKIVYVPDAFAFTEAPGRLRDLARQRIRWFQGLIGCLTIHANMFFNPVYEGIGAFFFPYLLFFKLLGPVIEVVAYIFTVYFFFQGILGVNYAYLFFAIALGYGTFLSAMAVITERVNYKCFYTRESLVRLLTYALYEHLIYHYLAVVWSWQALIGYFNLRGHPRVAGWHPAHREGFPILP